MELMDLKRSSGWALVPPRMALGATMAYHGASKLTAEGLEKHTGMFAQMGLKPARPLALATGLAEVFAGATTLLGIGTRLGAAAILATQAVAIAKVHAAKGFDIQKGGFEFNLALCGIALGMLIAGPGKASVSSPLKRRALFASPKRLLRGKRPTRVVQALCWLQ